MGELDQIPTNDNLTHLKETFITVATSIDKMKEPINELNTLATALAEALIQDRCGTDKDFATFLYEDLAPGLVKRLHKERSNDENYLKVVADTLMVLVKLFSLELQKKRFNYAFYSSMTLLFNHEAVIHKYHFQIPDSELQKLRTFGQEWRKELDVGSMVDVYVKADDRGRLSGWMQAQVVKVDNDDLYLEFPLSSNIYDGLISRWSTELVQFETKTKADYEWRKNVVREAVNLECDVHDKSSWNKATIFEVKKQTITKNRVIDIAHCGLRVYRDIPNSMRKDERGTFEGWSNKFDEWIPVFCPRIMPWATKVGVIEEEDLTDDIDDLIKPDSDFKQIYAVPRLQVCISALYLRYINIFGNEGGFDAIIELLQNPNVEKDYEGINITIMGCLAQILTLPYPVFHKNFIESNGQKIADTIKARLLMTTDQALRDVRKEQIDAIIKSVDNISRRFLTKDNREKQSEILRIELCNKSLKSSYLERRIQGIRDFNLLIKNNTLYSSSKTFTTDQLIDWMVQNDVFSQIWDPRKTHVQLVQRSNEIFKLLLKENKLDDTLLKLFWSLTKSEYQSEVLKIIQECSFYLRQPQIEFFYNEVTSQPAEKLSLSEFDLLCDLGKQCKVQEFQRRVGEFFWHIILNAENYKEDLVENATKKYSEMVKLWPLVQKKDLFVELTKQIKSATNSILPTLRLFTRLIKDQKDRMMVTYSTSYNSNQQMAAYSHVTASGSIITSYSYKPVPQAEESIYNAANKQMSAHDVDAGNQENEKELTLTEILNGLQDEHGFVDTLLENLFQYCRTVREQNVDAHADRKKLFVVSKVHSHADEIQERLQFLKYYASVSDYQFRKVQLRVIYDSLSVQSPIRDDQTEFLNWCKQACQDSTSQVVILDLNEVGEYFSELLVNKSLDVESLPIAGFEFLQNYFISINENSSNLIKQPKRKAAVNTTAGVTWNSYYTNNVPEVKKTDTFDEPEFNVLIKPSQLQKLDLIWMVVLQAQNQVVAKRAVNFIIKIYMSLDESIIDQRGEILQQLITECISILGKTDVQFIQIERIIQILKSVIQEAEKKGTGDVQPHNAILKGESLDRIIINNATKVHAPNLIVKVYSSATAWEFVDKVSRMCNLAPQFVDIRFANGQKIKDTDYGKTLGELGLKNYEVITVRKNDVDDEVPQVPLTENGKLVEKAYNIFNEWYDLYSNADGVMTPESATRFILGATNEPVSAEDKRIKDLFAGYDSNNDGVMERHEFLKFYETASRDRAERVFDNLKNHYIRGDLSKLSDLYEDQSFAANEMPRHTLSHNQEQFDTLLNLLDRSDGSSPHVWELIRSLATNQQIYSQVLSLQIPNNKDNVTIEDSQHFWQLFFNSGSIYIQSYIHEIIEALMEDAEDLTNRVFFVEYQDVNYAQNQAMLPKVNSKKINQENHALKQNWTNKFLENGGLQYIINAFFTKSSEYSQDHYKLQDLKFMLTIMRVFISAGIQAKSEINQGTQPTDNTVLKMMDIMRGPNGTKILDDIDFKEIQSRLLQLIIQIVPKEQHTFVEQEIIGNAMTLWKCCVFYKPELFLDFLTTDKVDELIMSGLLYCTQESIRSYFQVTLLEVAKGLTTDGTTETALGFLLKLLSKNFSQISKYPCRQFFELFNSLIDLHFIKVTLGSEEKDLFNPEQLLGQIIDKIRSDNALGKLQVAKNADEIVAKEAAQEKERLMIGLIMLTQKIITKVDKELSEKIVSEKDLINEIFKEFLFSSVFSNQGQSVGKVDNMLDLIKSRGPRKVTLPSTGKSVNKAREVAYQLLNDLIRKSPVIMNNFIKNQLQPLLSMIKKPKTWNYTPPNSSERVQKYVGIRNLGCICYMNSMLQQFFMIPAFRYNLLCVDDGKPEVIKEYKQEQIDDNMLHQMQRLFAHLELSERQDYNPIGFTFSFKEFDGGPTNTSEQKDAQEFLTALFDRLETQLKPTSRKYLTQSVFGGKECSQLICPECGKTKNKIQDYSFLSLTVKDLSSIYDSLAKQIEGEVINDYKCEGCEKKVDITKRTLIAETPNVLIVHLQRILFNFDTFQNDKLNQHFVFPKILDLKPYSYHEVMKKEHREQKKEEGEGDQSEEETQPEVQQESKEVKEEDEQPIEDDCWEYKLVGVNVHSGSANAGHYWSYINTARGLEEKNGSDPSWAETEKDQWMEFNDSTVKDYKFENLEDECFGDQPNSQSTASAWNFGGKYGKSGYMLFYERRVKKPIKIVIAEEQKDKHSDLIYDAKSNEYIKHIAFREGVDNETPNNIFTKVLEDNTKFTFENDVYSQEFFDFLKTILQSVASFGGLNDQVNKEMRAQSIAVAQKAAFDILARCFYNSGIKDIIVVMTQIFEQDDQLVKDFCTSILDTQCGEALFELLLDCTDSTARSAIGDLFKYLLCKLKMIEKDTLLTDSHLDTVSARFILTILSQLNGRVAKAWSRFEKFLELFQAFALNSPQEILQQIQTQAVKTEWSAESEAAQVGMSYFFKTGVLEQILDFVLGEKSPLFKVGESRIVMGGSYSQPNFSCLMKVVSEMIGAENLIAKYPLSPNIQQMLSSGVILAKIVEDNAQNKDFGAMLTSMCKDNYRMTKKLAKIFFKAFNQNSTDKIAVYLKALMEFVLIKDEFQVQRLEWLFGIPQIKTFNGYNSLKYSYGVEVVERINDHAYNFVTTLSPNLQGTSMESSLLERIIAQRGRLDDFCIKGVKDLMTLCIADRTIAEYIYRMPPYNFAYSRYCDWFRDYLEDQRNEQAKNSLNTYAYYQQRALLTQQAFEVLLEFEKVCAQIAAEDQQRLQSALKNEQFVDEVLPAWLHQNPEVIKHFPPQFIVGKAVSDQKPVLKTYEDDFCKVELLEVTCEYMYSNPTGLFNLSLSEKLMRTKNYTFTSYQQYKEATSGDEQESQLEVREWNKYHREGPVILQLLITSKFNSQLKVQIEVGILGDAPNVNLPHTPIKDMLFSQNVKVIGHFLKLDPTQGWGGEFTLKVGHSGLYGSIPKQTATYVPVTTTSVSVDSFTDYTGQILCSACQATAFVGEDYCGKCGESLKEAGVYSDYF